MTGHPIGAAFSINAKYWPGYQFFIEIYEPCDFHVRSEKYESRSVYVCDP